MEWRREKKKETKIVLTNLQTISNGLLNYWFVRNIGGLQNFKSTKCPTWLADLTEGDCALASLLVVKLKNYTTLQLRV